jgi:dTDP-glucose 4,6-dehydratase
MEGFMRVLVTGGAGFIGHHLIEHLLINTDWEIVSLDRLDTSGNLNRLAEILHGRHGERLRVSIIHHDLRAAFSMQLAKQIGRVDRIFHLAAATHVDRSIEQPMEFVMDNVVATCNLLDYARTLPALDYMLHFSTDEVFGPCPGTPYQEWDRYKSGNPYAATKAGAEELCLAYANTYKLPVFITHCMNVFGERQHPEKFIPSTIMRIRNGNLVTIHSNAAKTKAGSRFYIHARNVAAAILFLSERWERGEKYNIVGEREVDNLELAQFLAAVVGKPLRYELVDFHSSRPGHDLRYALHGGKLAAMGWKLPVNFESSLQRTIKWTLAHEHWL